MSALTDAAAEYANAEVPDGRDPSLVFGDHLQLVATFHAGAQWQAEQEPTDEAVRAALASLETSTGESPADWMRAAIRAAYAPGGTA